jgi:hypothetical protein
VAGVLWTVKEGKQDEFDGRVIASGFRSAHPVREPSLGDVLRLPDGSGPWRVVDWKMGSSAASSGNVLVVERFDG